MKLLIAHLIPFIFVTVTLFFLLRILCSNRKEKRELRKQQDAVQHKDERTKEEREFMDEYETEMYKRNKP